jgi:pSer/pThr/pTyr-binding forkhead associated (FHA) protein
MVMESNILLRLDEQHQQISYYEFDTYLITVGRGIDRNIDVNYQFISRRHATIYVNPQGQYILRDGDLLDIKSKNGIYLNGNKVDSESCIKNNDVITFCEGIDYPQLIVIKVSEPPNEETTAIYKS